MARAETIKIHATGMGVPSGSENLITIPSTTYYKNDPQTVNYDRVIYYTAENIYEGECNLLYENTVPAGAIVTKVTLVVRDCFTNCDISSGITCVNFRVLSSAGYGSVGSFKENLYTPTTASTEHRIDLTDCWLPSAAHYDKGMQEYPFWQFSVTIQPTRAGIEVDYDHYGNYIEIECTIPDYFDVTTNVLGDGTAEPAGSIQVMEGKSSTIVVTPSTDLEVMGTDNDLPITWTVLSNTSAILPADTYNKGISSTIKTESGLSNAVGDLAETTTLSPANAYSGSSGTYADFYYTFDTSAIPRDAQNIKVTCVVKAKPENYTQANERLKFQLAIGSTAIGTAYDFKDSGTSNLTIQTIASDVAVSREDLASLRLNGEIGYYGGGVAGITLTVSYSSATPTYSYEINNIYEDHDIIITIGDPFAIKLDGNWTTIRSVYKKINGVWVEQPASNIRGLFATHRYIRIFPAWSKVNLTQDGRWVDSGTTVEGQVVYKSNDSYQVNDAKDVARITVFGYNTLKLYIRSYAESTYDYTEAFEVNTAAVRAQGKYTTKGKQSATNYVECIYTLDPNVESFIDVMYSKDNSTHKNDDRGYFYYIVE